MATTTNNDDDIDYEHVLLEYICPSLGCIVAAAMCAAPIQDLRHALTIGTLGELNPVPWVFMTGTTLGWCAYAYYTNDPFVLVSNLPGLILSLWLNQGAIKLQYLELRTVDHQHQNDQSNHGDGLTIRNSDDMGDDGIIINGNDNEGGSPSLQPPDHQHHSRISPEAMIFVPQEVRFYRLLLVWSAVLVWVGWISPYLQATYQSSSLLVDKLTEGSPAELVGLLTNINLILFFGAPLTTILEVYQQRQSSSIHRPTMYMNLLCATFWTGYGFARMDPIIIIPNGIGMLLGAAQIVLCAIFPREGRKQGRIPLRGETYDDDENDDYYDEDGLMMTKVGTNGHLHASKDDVLSQEEMDAELDDDDLELL